LFWAVAVEIASTKVVEPISATAPSESSTVCIVESAKAVSAEAIFVLNWVAAAMPAAIVVGLAPLAIPAAIAVAELAAVAAFACKSKNLLLKIGVLRLLVSMFATAVSLVAALLSAVRYVCFCASVGVPLMFVYVTFAACAASIAACATLSLVRFPWVSILESFITATSAGTSSVCIAVSVNLLSAAPMLVKNVTAAVMPDAIVAGLASVATPAAIAVAEAAAVDAADLNAVKAVLKSVVVVKPVKSTSEMAVSLVAALLSAVRYVCFCAAVGVPLIFA